MSRRLMKALGGAVVMTALVGAAWAWYRKSSPFGEWHEYEHSSASEDYAEGKGPDTAARSRSGGRTRARAEALDLARTAVNDVASATMDLGRTAQDRTSDLIGAKRTL